LFGAEQKGGGLFEGLSAGFVKSGVAGLRLFGNNDKQADGVDMDATNETTVNGFWVKPATGTALMVASGLSFFFLCMILPIVGPSGAKQEHYGANLAAFIGVLLLTFLLSSGAAYSKWQRRKLDGSPLPYVSFGMSGLCILILLVLVVGGFAI
jgi:hypothetical protein